MTENYLKVDAPLALLILVSLHVGSYVIGYTMHIEEHGLNRFVNVAPWLKPVFRTPRSDGRYDAVALSVQLASIACATLQLLLWVILERYERLFASLVLLVIPHLLALLLRTVTRNL